MGNAQVHDTVFRDYFNDKKRLLSLCNALLDTGCDDPADVVINTVEGTFFSNLKNDLSCIIRDYFVMLIEHQSLLNANMPLRCLSYMTELLQNYVAARGIRQKLFTSSLVTLPRPRCFVMYEGKAAEPLLKEEKLSAAFGGDDTVLELKVAVLNINRLAKESGEERLGRCRELLDYVFFVNLVDEYKKALPPKQAVQKAIDDCIRQDVMAGYLRQKKNEVFDMMAFQWNEEEARQAWKEEGREEGRETGRKEGIKEGIKKGRKEGIITGRKEGREEGIILSIKKMMAALQLSARKAMEVLDIPPAEYEKYDKLLLAHN